MRHPWSVAVVLTVATATALAQRHELAVTPLSGIGVCSREAVKLVGTQPIEARGKLHLPRTIPEEWLPQVEGVRFERLRWIRRVSAGRLSA
jgi:hypothetical protein